MNTCDTCRFRYKRDGADYCGRGGAAIHYPPPTHTLCDFQRQGGWLFARLAYVCGNEGRWFEAVEDVGQ